MTSNMSQKEGEFLVRLARQAIVTFLRSRKQIPPPNETPFRLTEKSGVFVTLNDITKGRSLRGCIGFPLPQMSLVKATIGSAIEAATGDPRFDPVTLEEFDDRIVIEVSVLTKPTLVNVKDPREYIQEIVVGRDGLVIERGPCQGLLLPQVPVEYCWDTEEFICQCCMKAGLPPDAWLVDGSRIYKFQAIVFEEERPNGPVRLKPLAPEGK